MRRRALLSSLGVTALSGCSGLLVERGDETTRQATTRTTRLTETGPPPESTEETTETTPSDEDETTEDSDETSVFPPQASIVDLQTGPLTLALSPLDYRSNDGAKVEVEFASTATAVHPAIVRATLTNANDYANTFRLAETPPFREITNARLRDRQDLTYKSEWYLVPTANHDLVDDSPDYVRGPEGYWRLTGNPSPRLPETTRLAPGETIEGEWVLLGQSEGSGRPTGTYEFRGYADRSIAITAWKTDAPGPKSKSRLASASPPPLPHGGEEGGSGQPHWYHDAGAETAVYLEPSYERVRTPVRIDFTLYNHARKSATGNPYDWSLYKLVDDQWYHIAPWAIPMPLGSVAPGGTEDWTLYAFDGGDVHVEGGTGVGFLGGGRYAFEVGMSHDDRSHAALFELLGPKVAVEPMPGAVSSRDGATVTVDAPDPDHDRKPGTLLLTRADAADERLIVEQVMQPRLRALRNGLGVFDSGVEKVVVRTTENAAENVTGYDSKTRRFRFEGQAYQARFEAEESE